MRAPRLVSDFFDWRWAPCVGLTAGSLAFVALALLLIPTRLGGAPRADSTLSSFDSPRPQRAIFSSSLARSATLAHRATESEDRGSDDLRVARSSPTGPQGVETSAPPQRGFSPVMERAEPVPALPATGEPPAPAPGTVVVVQPGSGGESREGANQ